MPGKRAASSGKTSAHSKRHKASGGGGSKGKSRAHGGGAGGDRDSAAKEAAEAKQRAKKERKKGKGPAFIELPSAKRRRRDDEGGDGGEGGSDDDEDEDAIGDSGDDGMEVDEDLAGEEALEGAGFLTKLDKKGMSTSRSTIAETYKKEKPAALPRTKSAFSVPVAPAAPTKSELKAAKKRDIEKKKKRKAAGSDYESDEEDDEPRGKGGKAHPEGELVDDLESDDFAFGSGSDDDLDELSSMSEWSDAPEEGEFDDETDLGSTGDEDEEGLWSDEDEEGGEGADDLDLDDLDSAADGEDGSSIFDSELDGSDEEADGEEETRAAKRQAKKARLAAAADELEAAYEARPKKKLKEAKALPTKLPTIVDGKVVRSAEPLERSAALASEDEEEEEEEKPQKRGPEYKSDPLGQRFGRPAVRQLLETKNKRERVQKAREEIADLGREAAGTGEGEGGLNLLKRLLSLCAPTFNSSSAARSAGEKPIQVDREIRIMAMVSLLAVFIDVVPGYRIRSLTEDEKDTQVSQQVARQREWENGLVATYKRFLELCEAEVAENTSIASASLHCLCTLVREKPDFNFAVNIMDTIVKRLGRKGWDEGHQICLEAVVYIFQNDTTTTASNSLHLVRLISRLVRARAFAIRPEVISSLLNLRLKDELGGGRLRASADAVFREREGKHGIVRWNKEKNHRGRKGGKAKEAMAKKGSKKARQAKKEQEAVDKEIREAEGELNQQERERNQTETLKLLFALYFRIVKLDYRSPLLPAALEGLARFAHLVNIDFFRDLLEVLKGHILKGTDGAESDGEDVDEEDFAIDSLSTNVKRNDTREKLLCVVTAFELLQGQGESLNIDLGEFVSALYALILPLSFSPTFEEAPYLARSSISEHRNTHKLAQTEADLLFRALSAVFLVARSLPSPIRTMAFSKRLLSASLHWPPTSQLRTLGFLRSLLLREPRLAAMLETGDRRIDGRWRGEVDEPERAQPESTCWWELGLYGKHPDPKVREEAKKLGNSKRE
ncbi:hypothetical protein JCM8097_007078 [Rhodosporidiobolus ruineniae]